VDFIDEEVEQGKKRKMVRVYLPQGCRVSRKIRRLLMRASAFFPSERRVSSELTKSGGMMSTWIKLSGLPVKYIGCDLSSKFLGIKESNSARIARVQIGSSRSKTSRSTSWNGESLSKVGE
jgi:hypothetical protein